MPANSSAAVPLCVDLDETLCRTDTIWDLIIQALRSDPLAVINATLSLLQHRSWPRWKVEIAECCHFDASHLPWRKEVIATIAEARQDGRRIVLATASTQAVADEVGKTLGIFDEVLGSDSQRNLKARNKAEELVRRFGEAGFDYIGDSHNDVPVWLAARRAYVVAPASAGSPPFAAQVPNIETIEVERASRLSWLVQLRPHQWIKNTLVFLPVLTSHSWFDASAVANACLAFFSFCCAASAGYCLNDIVDAKEDRTHRDKAGRPVARGDLSVPQVAALGTVLTIFAWLPSITLPGWFSLALGGYFLMAGWYILAAKRWAWWDVSALGLLYVGRVLAGGAATGIGCSWWLIAFVGLFFPNLAVMKRYAEVALRRDEGQSTVPGRAYISDHLGWLYRTGGVLSIASALIVLAYAFSPQAEQLYRQPYWLIGCALAIITWERFMWRLATSSQLSGDPVICALLRWESYLVLAVMCGSFILSGTSLLP